MSTICVDGRFVFEGGGAWFTFGDTTIHFNRIITINQLHDALEAIAHEGSLRSCKVIMASADSATKPEDAKIAEKTGDTLKIAEKAGEQLTKLIQEQERKFRQYQEDTQRALRQAEADYEAETANVLRHANQNI